MTICKDVKYTTDILTLFCVNVCGLCGLVGSSTQPRGIKMNQEITLISALNTSTATKLVSQSFGSVLDLRTDGPLFSTRPIEEPVLRTLTQGFMDYRQLPVDLTDEHGAGLKDALVAIFSCLSPLVLVVEDVEAWRDELAFVGVKTKGLRAEAPVHFDVAA